MRVVVSASWNTQSTEIDAAEDKDSDCCVCVLVETLYRFLFNANSEAVLFHILLILHFTTRNV